MENELVDAFVTLGDGCKRGPIIGGMAGSPCVVWVKTRSAHSAMRMTVIVDADTASTAEMAYVPHLHSWRGVIRVPDLPENTEMRYEIDETTGGAAVRVLAFGVFRVRARPGGAAISGGGDFLTIVRGDDTASNRRTIRFRFPDIDIGSGYVIGFSLLGVTREGDYVRGGGMDIAYTREETAAMPFGVHYGSVYIRKDGLMETITNELPVRVTDSVALAKSAVDTITLSVTVNTGVRRIDTPALDAESTAGDIKRLANDMRAAINGEDAPAAGE